MNRLYTLSGDALLVIQEQTNGSTAENNSTEDLIVACTVGTIALATVIVIGLNRLEARKRLRKENIETLENY
jgi:hypothetical protein